MSKEFTPDYYPGHETRGTVEKRDTYESWWYKTYVVHCEENDCPGCDKCVPYYETLSGRAEGYRLAQERKNQVEVEEIEPIKYDTKIRKYFQGNKIL